MTEDREPYAGLEPDQSNTLVLRDPAQNDIYVRFVARIIFATNLTATSKILYAMLLKYAREDEFCYPGQDRLCRALGVGAKPLRSHLRELTEVNMIEIKRQGQGRPNVYTILDIRWAKLDVLDGEKTTYQVHKVDREKSPGLDRAKSTDPDRAKTTHYIEAETTKQRTTTETTSPSASAEALVFQCYKDKVQHGALGDAKAKITRRLKKFTVREIVQAIDNFSECNWWMEHNSRRGAEWFFASDARIEQFLNLDPEKENRGNGNGRAHTYGNGPAKTSASKPIEFGLDFTQYDDGVTD